MTPWRTGILAACIALLGCGIVNAQRTQPLQHRWEVDPDFGSIWDPIRRDMATSFDVEELNSPQIQQRLNIAQRICLNHHREGFEQGPRALELLLQRLASGREPLLVQRSMLSAACLLDDGEHAKTLWELGRDDPVKKQTLDRALSRWKSDLGLESWRSTLRDRDASASEVALALEGMGVVGSASDTELVSDTELLQGVMQSNRTTPSNRFLAARALGAINATGMSPFADELLGSELADRYLLAAALLQQHSDDLSFSQLTTILAEGSNPAKRMASSSIAKSYPESAAILAPEWAQDADPILRMLAVEVLNRDLTASKLDMLGAMLSDPDDAVRVRVREQLFARASSGFRDQINAIVTAQLASEDWRGIEQAILLAAQLDDRTRCAVLVPLLEHSNPQVHLHAGWALMEMGDAPEILDGILAHCERMTAQLEKGEVAASKSDILRLSYLLESIGRNRDERAVAMLRKYIPKDNYKMGNMSRMSAIWSLGQILRDVDDPQLRSQLRERIEDLPPSNPENYLVRFACILALGEFGYADSKATIEGSGANPSNPLGRAATWALDRIATSGR